MTTDPDPVPDEKEVEIEVKTEQSFTETHPARISVHFTNTAESARRFDFGSTPPYSDYTGEHTAERANLVLVPDTRKNVFPADPVELTPDNETETATRYRLVPTEPIDGCWYAGGVVGANDLVRTPELQPGETITERYTLLAHPLNEQCLLLGKYRFETEMYFGENEQWGFSVSLRQPN